MKADTYRLHDFRTFHLFSGDDLKGLRHANVVLCPKHATGQYGWLDHDSEDAFAHTCAVLADRVGCSPSDVRAAHRLLTVHIADSHHNVWIRNDVNVVCDTYGVSREVGSLILRMSGEFSITNVCRLARCMRARAGV